MCGFIGIVSQASAGNPRQLESRLSKGLLRLRARGPDADKIRVLEGGAIGLGFARLAIVDADDRSHQPLTNSTGELHTCVNGEIYNYREIRAERVEYCFKTNSDIEAILAVYSKFGIDGLKKLRGMFAGCIVDSARKRIFIFRDPIGKKPLYILEGEGEVLFGSSLLSLVSANLTSVSLNDSGVQSFWDKGWVNPSASVLKHAKPVLPGQVMEFNFDGRRLAIHDCTPEPLCIQTKLSMDECSEQLDFLLRQSVERRLQNNPFPIALLSGGIDSTVVSKLMFESGGGVALTGASWPFRMPDEKFAAYAARRIGIHLTPLQIESKHLGESVRWSLSLQDEPIADIAFFTLAKLIEKSKETGKVLLTGDGGDEVFLGYDKVSAWSDAKLSGYKKGDLNLAYAGPEWLGAWGKWTVNEQLLGQMLVKSDRASSEQGVELRSPLLDYDLVEFCRQMSPEFLFMKNRSKGALKSQLKGWPDSFVNRRKQGFTLRLRWIWSLTNYAGLREMINATATERFGHCLPRQLNRPIPDWSAVDIHRNFATVWKLATWSAFEDRLESAHAEQLT